MSITRDDLDYLAKCAPGSLARRMHDLCEQLRADLERVTKERDVAYRQRDQEGLKQHPLLDGYDRLQSELAETKAALETAKRFHTAEFEQRQQAERELSEARAEWEKIRSAPATNMRFRALAEELADCLAELAQLQLDWALFILRGTPSVRVNAELLGVPESVAALVRAGAGLPIGDEHIIAAELARRGGTGG